MIYYAEYGTAWDLHGYQLVDRATGQYKVTPTIAAGDFKIEKDGGAAANLATLPVVTPSGGSSLKLSFSAEEMQCKQAVIRLVDAAGAEWNDDCIHIFTVGDTLAHWQSNPFSGVVALSSASQSAVVASVWTALRADYAVAGSFGEGAASVQGNVTGDVVGNVNGNVGGNVTGSVGSVATGGITSTSMAADALSASAVTTAAAQKIADEILNRNLAGGGSGNSRNVRNALRGLRNRVRNQGGTLSIYEEDDTTIAWTAATTTSAGDPMTELDPT